VRWHGSVKASIVDRAELGWARGSPGQPFLRVSEEGSQLRMVSATL
jgi:hypothetical protein